MNDPTAPRIQDKLKQISLFNCIVRDKSKAHTPAGVMRLARPKKNIPMRPLAKFAIDRRCGSTLLTRCRRLKQYPPYLNSMPSQCLVYDSYVPC